MSEKDASRLQWCGNKEPHGRHEWIDHVTRRDCPGVAVPCTTAQRLVNADRKFYSALSRLREAIHAH